MNHAVGRARVAAWAGSWRRSGARGWLVAAVAALGLSFLDPSLPWPQSRQDVVVVLDVTQSMEVADVERDGQPVSRLAQSKWALAQVVKRLPCGSRLGWGIFTEYRSFLLLAPVEVCSHQRELLAELSHIDGAMAWTGNSEVAKGLYSALKTVKALPSKPALVFFTDGQEAPPINAQYRPSDEGAVRVAPGLVVGVGGPRPVPIPKLDLEGRSYGYWTADEVLQVDPRSVGRGGSVAGEQMAGDAEGLPSVMIGATPGSEHLSSLRESYLRLLAGETGLQYERLDSAERLYTAMTDSRLTHPVPSRADLRWVLAVAALACLCAIYRPSRRGRSVGHAQRLAPASIGAGSSKH